MIERWESQERCAPIDIGAEMAALSLEILSRAILGVSIAADAQAVAGNLTGALEYLSIKTRRAIDWPAWCPIPRNRRFHAHRFQLDKIVKRIIDARRCKRPGGSDLTAILLEARGADGARLDVSEMGDQIKTFLLAGHETTANLLTWSLALLGAHPMAQGR